MPPHKESPHPPIRLTSYIAEKGKQLESAGIDRGTAEIETILCSLLDLERLQLYLYGESLLTDSVLGRVAEIISKRLTRYPLQYILGESWFYGRRFKVTPAVMIPTPETELLCDTAIRYINEKHIRNPRIVDLGVGSGVISITLALELADCRITALDISDEALDIARENAALLKADHRISFLQSDYFAHVTDDTTFDLILANPPYISDDEYTSLPPEVLADPKISLTSGQQGLDAIKVIVRDAPRFLAPGGRLMLEIGYNQAERVADLTAQDDRYRSIVILKDLNDIDRIVILECENRDGASGS